MTLRERLHWILRMALLLFILASVAFLSALTAMRFAIKGREVVMPDLVGTGAVQARQILNGRGLVMRVEDHIYSHSPVDAVVRQSPPPNLRVKIGQDAHVVLSLGPQKVTIPQLQQLSVRAVQIELLRGGMHLGEISSAYLPGTAPDTVLQQYPAPGTTDATSPHVNLLVALGPRPPAYVMPNLFGLPAGKAESTLAAAGLKVSKITTSPAAGVPEAPHGAIIGQTPSRGQRVDASTTIELQEAE
jgi:eukaryotic-like serine/threonine-protein kinase